MNKKTKGTLIKRSLKLNEFGLSGGNNLYGVFPGRRHFPELTGQKLEISNPLHWQEKHDSKSQHLLVD